VEDALGLTEWVLQETPRWSPAEIDALLATARETRIDLDTKVPIHILYFTAVADPDGGLRLLNDLYDRDALLFAALDVNRLSSRCAAPRWSRTVRSARSRRNYMLAGRTAVPVPFAE
jgi:murein L,D-transpeptidase YcbB/YkuD